MRRGNGYMLIRYNMRIGMGRSIEHDAAREYGLELIYEA